MAYSDEVLADNPIHWWRLDEESGNIAANEIDATKEIEWYENPDIGRPSLLSGDDEGRSVRFNLGESNWGWVSSMPRSIYTSEELSVEAWVKIETPATAETFIDHDNGKIQIGYDDLFNMFFGKIGGIRVNSTIEPEANSLYHIVVTAIRIPSTSVELNIYINGELVGTETFAGSGVFSNVTTGSEVLSVNGGAYFQPTPETYSIDEIAIYDSELDSNRVAAHYVAGASIVTPVYESESTEPGWKVYLHDWNGARIGELTDARNIQINTGLNKNSSMSFETTLLSPLGKQLADRDYSLITAWRRNPYNNETELKFSGMVFTTEENGEDDTPSIAVSAVGPYWRLSRRVANDATNAGRKQSGIAPAPSGLTLLVANRNNNRIQLFNAKTGANLGSFGSGSLSNPEGVAVGRNNEIYVADTGNHRIRRHTSTGALINQWGSNGSGDLNFNTPTDVGVDNSGNVWVVDNGNSRVVKYTRTGTLLFKVNIPSGHSADLRGISIDNDGFVRVGNMNAGTANRGWYRISPTGNLVPGTGGNHRQVLRDNKNNTYFVQGGGSVFRRTPSGKKASRIYNGSSVPAQSVVVGSDRTIYVCIHTSGTSEIKRYDAAGNLTRTIGSTSSLNNPRGLALLRASSRDAVEIASEVITNTNQQEGTSWVRAASPQGSSQKIFANPGTWGGYKRVSEVIEDLSSNYEWKIIPRIEVADDQLVLGDWYANSVIGEDKSNLVTFEYGTGRNNADSYVIRRSLEGLATKASYPAADAKPYSITATANNANEIGIFEDIVTGDLVSQDLRRALLQFALRFRKQPRLLIEISPARSDQTGPDNLRTPIPLIDYDIGDIIGLEIVEDGSQRIATAAARIYDISIEVDENGQETAKLNLYLDD